MDLIYECAVKFKKLQNCKYQFVVSKKRKTRKIVLNFLESDFFHLAGLQYLTDISIPKNRKDILKNIVEKRKITDLMLQKSQFFTNSQTNKNIKSRIEELRFLEEYLDTDNYIRIYSIRNLKYLSSNINAEYIIESRLGGAKYSVYIFLRERKEMPGTYGVVSFFKKEKVTYGGDNLYWLLKEKICDGYALTLYKHPDYDDKSLCTK